MLQRAMDHHKQKGAALFTDVGYEELIRDAQDVLKKIYTDRGEDISPELLEQFKQAEKMNPKGKYGKHIYDLEDFGIDSAYINSQTEEYQRFQLSKKEN